MLVLSDYSYHRVPNISYYIRISQGFTLNLGGRRECDIIETFCAHMFMINDLVIVIPKKTITSS